MSSASVQDFWCMTLPPCWKVSLSILQSQKWLNIPSAKKLLLDNKCLSLQLTLIVHWKNGHIPVVKSAQNTTTEAERESENVRQNLYDSVLTLGHIFCKSKFLSATEQQLCTLAILKLGKIANFIFAKKKSIFRFSTSEWVASSWVRLGRRRDLGLDIEMSSKLSAVMCHPASLDQSEAGIWQPDQSESSKACSVTAADCRPGTAGESVHCRVRSRISLWSLALSHL